MPQVIVKGISREKTAALAPRIAETVASIIAVPEEWIVVEHNEVAFFRGGKADAQSAMVVIQWKQSSATEWSSETAISGGTATSGAVSKVVGGNVLDT